MKTLHYLLGASVIVCLAFASCKNNANVQRMESLQLDLKSGDGIIKSIEAITANPSNWTQARFDSINIAINSLASANLLNTNINEHLSHLGNLFTSSAACLEHRVDSVFRLSEYRGYTQMQSDLAFLKSYNQIFCDAGVSIDEENTSLAKVSDIFFQYEKVKSLSNSQFRKTAHFLEGYNLSYERAQSDIENNRYYGTYFSHNSEIQRSIKDFPARVKRSKENYMSDLEKLIEEEAIEKKFSFDQLSETQSEFYKMAKGINQEAINKLDAFVTNYVDPTKEDTQE